MLNLPKIKCFVAKLGVIDKHKYLFGIGGFFLRNKRKTIKNADKFLHWI